MIRFPTSFGRRTRRDWLIWSRDRNAWWRADRAGYTLELADAGRYSEAEVRAIFAATWPAGDDAGEPRPLTSVAAELDREIALVQTTARSKLRNLTAAKAEIITGARRGGRR